MKIKTAVAILILNVVTQPAIAAEPYDLRGIKLGMSISEFKKLPHPDGNDSKVICTGDSKPEGIRQDYELSVYGDESKAGVIICNFYLLRPFPTRLIWLDAQLNVASINAYMKYKFLPDPLRGNELSLYAIIVRSNVAAWEKFWEGYTGKYGPPNHISDAPMQNKVGATFDNVVATWDNKISGITLRKRFERIDNSYIFYIHYRLSQEITRMIEKRDGKPSDKL